MAERTADIGVKVPPEIKAAAQKAARDDHRTVSSLVEKLLTEWLTERSYLSEGDLFSAPQAPAKGRRA